MKMNVSGPLEVLLKGLPVTDIRDIVDKPITDVAGNTIGAITSIDKDNWHGVITGGLYLENDRIKSFSITN